MGRESLDVPSVEVLGGLDEIGIALFHLAPLDMFSRLLLSIMCNHLLVAILYNTVGGPEAALHLLFRSILEVQEDRSLAGNPQPITLLAIRGCDGR